MYFSPEQETLSQDALKSLQLRRVTETLHRVLDKNDYYRQKYAAAGFTNAGDFKSLDDLVKLPLLSKEDFRKTYPMGMCCVPKSELREMHQSSGSTGTPVAMQYTEHDLDQWAECMARCYVMAGAKPGDPVQVMPSFGLFNGGFGMYHGARKAGLFIIPTGSGNTERQIRLAKEYGTVAFGSVVSYMLRIIEVMREMNIELPKLKIGVFGAESFSENMRNKIDSDLGIKSYDIYGMTETGGVGTLGQDCEARCGLHVWEDHYITEVLDSVTLQPVPDGEIGEVTITSLTREAVPVIRFRTGDLSKVVSREKCACGRTHIRIARITGRTDDMLIIKGVNFFPKQVENALMEIPGVLPQYQIIIEESDGVRDVRINVEAGEGITGHQIAKHLKERLGFLPKGDVFKPGELPRSEGKAQRVFYEKK